MPDCWLEVSLHPEGPATGQLDQGFPWFYSVLKQILLSCYPHPHVVLQALHAALPLGTEAYIYIYIFFFLILDCEAIGTAATPGLLCQPQVIVKMIVEKQMECRLAGQTEVLGENLPQRHFCPSQNPT
jgi:hypothetical protein